MGTDSARIANWKWPDEGGVEDGDGGNLQFATNFFAWEAGSVVGEKEAIAPPEASVYSPSGDASFSPIIMEYGDSMWRRGNFRKI